MKDNRGYSITQLRTTSPLMIVLGIFTLAFVVLAMAGVKFPLSAESFESTLASRIVTIAGGVLGILGGFIGIKASKEENMAMIRICAFIGFVVIILYSMSMFFSDGHTNPHVWILLGSFSIIPGSFGGAAIRAVRNGIDS